MVVWDIIDTRRLSLSQRRYGVIVPVGLVDSLAQGERWIIHKENQSTFDMFLTNDAEKLSIAHLLLAV